MVLDIGTGDGLYIYRSARANAAEFFIGIDANARPLEKISEKIYRRPTKGGLTNLLFVQSAIEEIPSELSGVASEVHVNFPWGSLLSAVAGGNEAGLNGLRRVCSVGGLMKVVLAIDSERDATEIKRLDLPELSLKYIDDMLASRYREAGFELLRREEFAGPGLSHLESSWARRLRGNTNRKVIQIVAQARDGQ